MKLNKFRKWNRIIHRDLSFFFSGVLIIYAISGIAMNHLNTYNPNYSIERIEYKTDNDMPIKSEMTKDYVVENLLVSIDEQDNYTKHYFPQENMMKVFLKGGSNLFVNTVTREVVYESVKPRYVMSAMAKLHYNPGGWWTTFSDIFAGGLVVIVISGLVMTKGRKGLFGIGGLELLAGAMVPLIYLYFF